MLLRAQPPAAQAVDAEQHARAVSIGMARFRVAEVSDGSLVRLQLRGELDLAAVPALRDRVRETASRDGVAILDLSGVVFIDVAGLSALSALVREARVGGWRLELRHASLAVRQLARLTSMQPLFDAA